MRNRKIVVAPNSPVTTGSPPAQARLPFADEPFPNRRPLKLLPTPAWVERLKAIKLNEKARLAAEQEQDSKCNSIATAAEVRVKG